MDLSPRMQNDCQTDICRTEFQKQYMSPKANAPSNLIYPKYISKNGRLFVKRRLIG
jgi:hypothetical protein